MFCFSFNPAENCNFDITWHTVRRTSPPKSASISECVNCPEGYQCSGGVKTLCASGYYSMSGMSTCELCKEGFYCDPSNSVSPIPCSNGTFSNPGASSSAECYNCRGKYKCVNGIRSMCQPGSKVNDSHDACIACSGKGTCIMFSVMQIVQTFDLSYISAPCYSRVLLS